MIIFLVLIGFVGGDATLASEPRIIDDDRVRDNAHPDSCTRWQQWDYVVCVDKTNYPTHLDAFHFLQLVTMPFIGGAEIFVVTTTTPSIAKRKRIAMIIPCAALMLFSPFV